MQKVLIVTTNSQKYEKKQDKILLNEHQDKKYIAIQQ